MNIVEVINNLIVQRVYAESLGTTLDKQLETVQGQGVTDTKLVTAIINIATPIAGIAVVLLLIYGGFLLMTSKGDPDKLQEGKQIITNAIIGFVVILLCVAILLLISNTLGLKIYE
jgi:protein-S-isoprenylcysteine O-methyltransferase Ste14